jgi:hypothetical protein
MKWAVVFAVLTVACGGSSFSGAPGVDASGSAGEASAAGVGSGSSGGDIGVAGAAAGSGGAQAGSGSSSGDGGAGSPGSAGASGVSGSSGQAGTGTAGVSGSSGSAGSGSASGSAGTGGCVADPAIACTGRECGTVLDGCGQQVQCGYTMCPVVSQYDTTPQQCVSGKCQVTCASVGRECGDDAKHGLSCGGCDKQPGGTCGLLESGVCAYCEDDGVPTAGVCPSGWHAWNKCSTAPASGCTSLGQPGSALQYQWCCPA